MNGGSTQQYLLYALGEIGLVVIGILIALQINNWNEEAKRDATLTNYMENLVENLKVDEARYKRMESSSYFRYYSLQYLIQLCGESPYDPTNDGHRIDDWKPNEIWNEPIPSEYDTSFIKLTFLWVHRTGNFPVNTPTMEELKSTGLYSHLREDLKDEINNYYTDWEFRFGRLAYERTNQAISEFLSFLWDNGMINSMPYSHGDPIGLLKSSPAMKGRLLDMIGHASWHVMSSKIIYKRSIKLQKLLKEEIAYLKGN